MMKGIRKLEQNEYSVVEVVPFQLTSIHRTVSEDDLANKRNLELRRRRPKLFGAKSHLGGP